MVKKAKVGLSEVKDNVKDVEEKMKGVEEKAEVGLPKVKDKVKEAEKRIDGAKRVEAYIDFPDEDIPQEILNRVMTLSGELKVVLPQNLIAKLRVQSRNAR